MKYNECVQCGEEMSEHGDTGDALDGKTFKILHAYRCLKPECPNYNLLQGKNETI
jgi:hypothetical protein